MSIDTDNRAILIDKICNQYKCRLLVVGVIHGFTTHKLVNVLKINPIVFLSYAIVRIPIIFKFTAPLTIPPTVIYYEIGMDFKRDARVRVV